VKCCALPSGLLVDSREVLIHITACTAWRWLRTMAQRAQVLQLCSCKNFLNPSALAVPAFSSSRQHHGELPRLVKFDAQQASSRGSRDSRCIHIPSCSFEMKQTRCPFAFRLQAWPLLEHIAYVRVLLQPLHHTHTLASNPHSQETYGNCVGLQHSSFNRRHNQPN